MSLRGSIDAKEVVFIGSSKADFEALPKAVHTEAVAALSILQNNRKLPRDKFRPLTGNARLDGIAEIRINAADGNAYRIYEIVVRREVLYVLEAGVKKSTSGIAIPSQDVERLARRKVMADADYEANKAAYVADYDVRNQRRTRLEVGRTRNTRRPK